MGAPARLPLLPMHSTSAQALALLQPSDHARDAYLRVHRPRCPSAMSDLMAILTLVVAAVVSRIPITAPRIPCIDPAVWAAMGWTSSTHGETVEMEWAFQSPSPVSRIEFPHGARRQHLLEGMPRWHKRRAQLSIRWHWRRAQLVIQWMA
ncbi:hypothetical protein C8R46DRAFT_1238674 [Mycena filopes]|nr:hypothetical protein C8R46DRAFT_1238674 [Mycena filopes]